MELSRGQQEYLLEMLSAEYIIPSAYCACMKEAINRYSRRGYCEEDLNFLVAMPQSLSAILLLNTTDSLPVFARYFSLWVNCVEYNALSNHPAMEAVLINPDPNSRQKLLQITSVDGLYQVEPVPELRYSPSSCPLEAACSPNRPISALSQSTFEGLLRTFLYYAEESDILPTACQQLNLQEYLNYLAQEQQRTVCHQFSWQQLRQQAPQLLSISSTYQWQQKQEGLILPSNLAFIHSLNAHPIKKHPTSTTASTQRTPQPFSPFHRIDQLMARFNPRQLFKNARPPKLPPLPFNPPAIHNRPPIPEPFSKPSAPFFTDNGHRRIYSTPSPYDNIVTKSPTENKPTPPTATPSEPAPTVLVPASTPVTENESST